MKRSRRRKEKKEEKKRESKRKPSRNSVADVATLSVRTHILLRPPSPHNTPPTTLEHIKRQRTTAQ
jgi:hypothetical protein